MIVTRQPLPSSVAGLVTGDPEAQVVEPDHRREAEPARGPDVAGHIVPAPAPDHPAGSPVRAQGINIRRPVIITLVVPIPAPLPDVPVHVVQPEGIGTPASHSARPPFRIGRVARMIPQAR